MKEEKTCLFKKGDIVIPTNECISQKVAKTAGRPMDRPDLPIYTYFEKSCSYVVKDIGKYTDGWHILVEGSTQFVLEEFFRKKIDCHNKKLSDMNEEEEQAYIDDIMDLFTSYLPAIQGVEMGDTKGGQLHKLRTNYARFINMFLYDLGIVPEEEPFKKLIHQGMITHSGVKMSKSTGNVINPDEYDQGHLRMYLMFLAHYFDGGSWSDEAFKGIERFDNRIKSWISKASKDGKTISLDEFKKKMDYNFESFKFNKVISEWMIFYNQNKGKIVSEESAKEIIELYRIINPGAF